MPADFRTGLRAADPDGSFRLVTGRAVRFPGPPPRPGMRMAVPSRAAADWVVAPDVDRGGDVRHHPPRRAAGSGGGRAEPRGRGAGDHGDTVGRNGAPRNAGETGRADRADGAPGAARRRRRSRPSFRRRILQEGISILPWNERSRGLLLRMRFYSRAQPDAGLGDLSDAGLAARAAEWLEPYLKLTGGQLITAGAADGRSRGAAGKGEEAPGGGSAGIDHASHGIPAPGRLRGGRAGDRSAHPGGLRPGGEPPRVRGAAHLSPALTGPSAASDHP